MKKFGPQLIEIKKIPQGQTMRIFDILLKRPLYNCVPSLILL